MIKLDKREPFGIIYGEHEACYYQNGKNFDAHGNEVGEGKEVAKVERPPKVNEADGSDWRALKKRVEDAGGVWSNSKNAVAYLENL